MQWFRVSAALCLFSILTSAVSTGNDGEGPIRRYGIFIGENEGRTLYSKLKYATTDATSMAKVMEEFGGIATADNALLLNPDKQTLSRRLEVLKTAIDRSRATAVRTELIFYYSGHSDEGGLQLGREKFSYQQLRGAVLDIHADVTVLILDSCASGNLTRLKGGKLAPAFLSENLSKLKGYVALTSASAAEGAQESDQIGGSFFTHYLVSGLRGAADANSTRRITVNEAYKYAYEETLARTQQTAAGPQHAAYAIQLTGTGELVMTDLRKASAEFLFDKSLQGRIYVRNDSGRVISEVDKTSSRETVLAVEPGDYSMILSRAGKLSVARFGVTAVGKKNVRLADFAPAGAEETTLRGSIDEEESQKNSWDVIAAGGVGVPWVSSPGLGGIVTVVYSPNPKNIIDFFGAVGVDAGAALFHAGADVGLTPFRHSLSIVPTFDLFLLAGASTLDWACGDVFGAPCGTQAILGVPHLGTRATLNFSRTVGLSTTVRVNANQAIGELGFLAHF